MMEILGPLIAIVSMVTIGGIACWLMLKTEPWRNR